MRQPQTHIKFPSNPWVTVLNFAYVEESRGKKHLEAERVEQKFQLLPLQGSRAWTQVRGAEQTDLSWKPHTLRVKDKSQDEGIFLRSTKPK